MCDIQHLQERLKTWHLLLQIDKVDTNDYNTRIADLRSRVACLEAAYGLLIADMKREYENAKGISVDSITS